MLELEKNDTSPQLAGSLLPTSNSMLNRWRHEKNKPYPGIPDSAYEDLITEIKSTKTSYVLVNDPVGIKRVLIENGSNYLRSVMSQRLTSSVFGSGLIALEGEVWQRHRRIMAPAFDNRRIAEYGPVISKASQSFAQRWQAKDNGSVFDVCTEMRYLSFQIISMTMFSTDSDAIAHLMEEILPFALQSMKLKFLDRFPRIAKRRMQQRQQNILSKFEPLDEAIEQLIETRENNPGAGDLLERLLTARDENGEGLSYDEIRDEVVSIFVAGHETSAQSLAWSWYLLSLHPNIEARLHEEVATVLQGKIATLEDIPRLTFTRQIVEETLRLYPSVPALSGRIAQADDEVCGIKIQKGTSVGIVPWFLHRHRKLWENPEKFDPDRFSPERSAGRSRLAFIPFGAGRHTCIGHQFAMNELILILSTLSQFFQLRLVSGQRFDLEASLTLRPRNGIKMELHRRR